MSGQRRLNRRIGWVLFLAAVWLWAVPVSAKAPQADSRTPQLSCHDAGAEPSSRPGTFHLALSPARRRLAALADLFQDTSRSSAGKQSGLCFFEPVLLVVGPSSAPRTHRDRLALLAVRRV